MRHTSRATDPAALRTELGRYGATLVLDFVGIDDTLRLGASLLGHGATSRSSASGEELSGRAWAPAGMSVSRISNGTIPELHEVVELARRGTSSLESSGLRSRT